MKHPRYFIQTILMTGLFFVVFSSQAQDYFQQEVNYKIDVRLDDKNHMLTGFERIEYTNNSPDKLEFIYFHLWPNAYKNNQTTLAREKFRQEGRHHLFNMERQRGFIDSLNFKVNGKKVFWKFHPDHIDIARVILDEPIEPGEKITITTPFRVKIPLGVTSRLGHIARSYKITQWYPKPAVYDSKGWHPIPYRDMGEFYSEYGSYDVRITLPKNYVVAATGQLRTKSEREWLNQKAVESKSKFSFDPGDMDFPETADEEKTIRYTIENAHDFAWFADKRYHVMKDSVKLPNSGRHVTTWAFFTNDLAELWRNATNYINDAIKYYSKWYGDYAYNNCTAILGAAGSRGTGMEYPTITAIGHIQEKRMLEEIIMHEVGHNWFYGMLGFNERRFPFLDEGINTFSEIRYMQNKYRGKNELYRLLGMNKGLAEFLGMEHANYRYMHALSYLILARQNKDQPITTSSSGFSRSNYAAISYSKTGLAFHHLMNYLGEERFNTIMKKFTNKWKFRHPYPEDLEQCFREHTPENLDWFFNDLLSTTNKIDYKIKKADNNRLLIKNKGNIKAPLVIAGFKDNTKTFSKWYQGFEGKQWLEIPDNNNDRYIIDPNKQMLEFYRHNNTLKTKGIFKKAEPLKFQFFGLLNDPDYTQIHYFPSIGWNYYNKTMLGGFFYDAFLPPDRFDYYLAPLYSTGNKSFAGTGEMAFNLYPNKTFHNIRLKISGKRFAWADESGKNFSRIKPEAVFTFKKSDPRDRLINRIKLSSTYATSLHSILSENEETDHQFYHNLTLLHDRSNRSVDPYKLKAGFELAGDFSKASLEGWYKYNYYKNEGVKLRLFGGTFLYKDDNLPWPYAFHLTGGSGFYDYTFDNTFLGRFEDPASPTGNQLLSQQFYPSEGAFAMYSPLGVTKDWLLSVNLSTSIPIIRDIPILAYTSWGTFGKTMPVGQDIKNTSWALETGIRLSFLQFMDIYFPIVASNNLEKASNNINSQYGEKIRFHLKFDIFKPTEFSDRLEF